MSDPDKYDLPLAPPDEQEVCVACGFCCDGTLFLHACLQPGERGHLPEKIEAASFSDNGEEFFHLPCLYFHEKCTIYDQPRADVCGSFRCELLQTMEKGEISKAKALTLVTRARIMRDELIRDFRQLTETPRSLSNPNFRQVLHAMGQWRKNHPINPAVGNMAMDTNNPGIDEAEILTARLNIFESLLIRHFRPLSEFRDMMVSLPPDKFNTL